MFKFLKNIFSFKEIKNGYLFSISSEGCYKVVKVLQADTKGVHIRIFSNKYDKRPVSVDEKTLILVGVKNTDPQYAIGMGHLPVSKKTFESWSPKFIKAVKVDESELDGYKLWIDGQGGYW